MTGLPGGLPGRLISAGASAQDGRVGLTNDHGEQRSVRPQVVGRSSGSAARNPPYDFSGGRGAGDPPYAPSPTIVRRRASPGQMRIPATAVPGGPRRGSNAESANSRGSARPAPPAVRDVSSTPEVPGSLKTHPRRAKSPQLVSAGCAGSSAARDSRVRQPAAAATKSRSRRFLARGALANGVARHRNPGGTRPPIPGVLMTRQLPRGQGTSSVPASRPPPGTAVRPLVTSPARVPDRGRTDRRSRSRAASPAQTASARGSGSSALGGASFFTIGSEVPSN